MANPDHFQLLLRGKDAWNEWRQKKPGESVDLSQISFGDHLTSFVGWDFGHGAKLSDSHFSHQAIFNGAKFGKFADFRRSIFQSEVHFAETTFGAGAMFKGTTFDSTANFKRARFGVLADFSGVSDPAAAQPRSFRVLNGPKYAGIQPAPSKFRVIQFRGARFDGVVSFRGREFTDSADFVDAHFGSPPDFVGTQNREFIDWTGAEFGLTGATQDGLRTLKLLLAFASCGASRRKFTPLTRNAICLFLSARRKQVC